MPKRKTYAEIGAPPEGDAVTALRKFAADPKDPKASQEDKALALRLKVHIVGDLHAPFHAGNGEDRENDDINVTFFGDPTNLHGVSDGGMTAYLGSAPRFNRPRRVRDPAPRDTTSTALDPRGWR